jgi:Cu+-exporting ATPase
MGVSASVIGRQVVIGIAAQMRRVDADPAPLGGAGHRRRREAAGVILVAVDGQLAGLLAVADPVRANAGEAMAALRAESLRVVMLTGDNRTAVDAVGGAVGGLDEVRADLPPEDKARIVAKLKARGSRVAYLARQPAMPLRLFHVSHHAADRLSVNMAGLRWPAGDGEMRDAPGMGGRRQI